MWINQGDITVSDKFPHNKEYYKELLKGLKKIYNIQERGLRFRPALDIL